MTIDRLIRTALISLVLAAPAYAETPFENLTPESIQAFSLEKAGLLPEGSREAAWTQLKAAEDLYWKSRLGDVAAVQELERRAARGDPADVAFWGVVKHVGSEGVEADPKERDRLFAASYPFVQRAAEQNVPSAQMILGMMYENGVPGVLEKDQSAAADWTRKAAEAGYTLAQNNLGRIYEKGTGGTKDPALALMWYLRAADQGHALAAVNAGKVYEEGEVVPRDERRALAYYVRAAQKGHLQAYHPIGRLFREGLAGLPQDDKMAVLWFKTAADKGSFRAQRYLGEMYEAGRGVPKDMDKAVALYRKAAAQGDQESGAHLDRLKA